MDSTTLPAWSFPFMPEPPHWHLDWEALVHQFDWLQAMQGCEQDPVYHAEGDVLVHTQLVCQALTDLTAWRQLESSAHSVVFASALLHDVAKPITSVMDADGRIGSPGHGRKGAQMARRILWRDTFFQQQPVPFYCREQIVALIRHSSLPFHLLDDAEPLRRAIKVSQVVRCDWLALLAEADARGRVCHDQQRLLDNIELFRQFCQEQRCFDQPYPFASPHSRFTYFRKTDGYADHHAYDTTEFTVILMSGLPGVGKDQWISTHYPTWPVISLDAIRNQLGIAPSKNQGPVIAAAKEQARQWMRTKQSFIWNATNVTRAMREQLIDLFAAYSASIKIVYLDADYSVILKRNRERVSSVPEKIIDKLADKLELPDMTEAHEVEYVIAQ